MPDLSPSAAPPADLILQSREPLNAEPPLDRLHAAFLARQADFYVRSHGNIPRLDATNHRGRVGGRVGTALQLTAGELRERFAVHTVPAVMQCAGNCRADMQPVKETSGDPWARGAIGNAEWTGARLSDLLRAARSDDGPGLHVAFESCDQVEMPDEGRFTCSCSIPMDKAMAPEVMVAWAMNRETLAPEHGALLRMVVPGYAGVRSAKWLAAITVQDRPSENHMQQRDYRLLPDDMTADTVDWAQGVTINDMPLNAPICEPAAFARLPVGEVAVRGYAVATSRDVTRVDVSANGGRSWTHANLERRADAPWSWTFWDAPLELSPGEHELVVRAGDSAGQTQPVSAADTWNFKDYLSAAWHRVRVRAG